MIGLYGAIDSDIKSTWMCRLKSGLNSLLVDERSINYQGQRVKEGRIHFRGLLSGIQRSSVSQLKHVKCFEG